MKGEFDAGSLASISESFYSLTARLGAEAIQLGADRHGVYQWVAVRTVDSSGLAVFIVLDCLPDPGSGFARLELSCVASSASWTTQAMVKSALNLSPSERQAWLADAVPEIAKTIATLNARRPDGGVGLEPATDFSLENDLERVLASWERELLVTADGVRAADSSSSSAGRAQVDDEVRTLLGQRIALRMRRHSNVLHVWVSGADESTERKVRIGAYRDKHNIAWSDEFGLTSATSHVSIPWNLDELPDMIRVKIVRQ
jgi:hypothetical protein